MIQVHTCAHTHMQEGMAYNSYSMPNLKCLRSADAKWALGCIIRDKAIKPRVGTHSPSI